jgi:hypothetical protein
VHDRHSCASVRNALKKKMLVFATSTTVHVRGPTGKKKQQQLCADLS